MGIVTNIRNKVKRGFEETAASGADMVTKLATLSPKQVTENEQRRQAYLSEMPSEDDELAEEFVKRIFGALDIEITNSYLPQISSVYAPIQEETSFSGNNRISYFKISKWVKDPDEDNIEKLMNVYQVLSEEECNIALIYDRKQTSTEVYLAVVNNGAEKDPSEVESYINRLHSAMKGNFPGADCILPSGDRFGQNVPDCLEAEQDGKKAKSVACVSNLASEKSENFVSQTIEKVLDGIVPNKEIEEYTIVLLATPVENQIERVNRLYEIYTALAPYASWQTNYTFTEMNATGSSASVGINFGIGAGKQSGIGQADADMASGMESIGKTKTEGEGKGSSGGVGGGIQAGGKHVKVNAQCHKDWNRSNTQSVSMTHNLSKTVGRTVTETASKGGNLGINAGANFARSATVSTTLGKNEGILRTFVNYGIKHTLENLELQVKRLEESAALGLWDFAAYVISQSSDIANNVAHTYMALTQGDSSYLSESAVNLWRADLSTETEPAGGDEEELDEVRKRNDLREREKEQAKVIRTGLSRLQHPEFCLCEGVPDEYLLYPTCVTATASISGKELAHAMNFPGKSICGLPVIEAASFGRNVSSYNKIEEDLNLGNIYYMHIEDKDVPVNISRSSLISHVFVTGSTGTGKTNTVAKLIHRVCLEKAEDNVPKFLIVEPAKGEYKSLLGGYPSVKVYGTNPKLNELLRINPFSFPKNITVSEHIDRLVEIFNVCWPMYAAMPAILKDAIISAYEIAGWDIDNSINLIRKDLFPGFVDVMEQVKVIVNRSEYSSDTRGDYSGALLSRLKSLTNGINGQIFCMCARTDKDLFDSNVIVDLSRVGAVETKSLIMGILMLKLQEYRISEKKPDRKTLEHITVLEEAHNLLRRTSLEQSAESSNLLGKSVEMITNAIAELRAFGEGFVIVDQAPGLLDMGVIRNTNTKIIHKLPDQSDRELVGKSAGLNDAQIMELSKLEQGVAAIYQNNWTEAVLCKVDEFKKSEKMESKGNDSDNHSDSEKTLQRDLVDYLVSQEILKKGKKADLTRFAELVIKSQMKTSIKANLLMYLEDGNADKLACLRKIMFDLLDASEAVKKADTEEQIENWVAKLVENVNPSLKGYTQRQIDLAVGLLVYELYQRDGSYRNVYMAYTSMVEGGTKWHILKH